MREEYAFAEADRDETMISEGGAPPTGWRMDKFGNGARERFVSVAPWSRRPPSCEPERWKMTPRRIQDECGTEWMQ